jgi:predicted AAA+ superfamily ATPase
MNPDYFYLSTFLVSLMTIIFSVMAIQNKSLTDMIGKQNVTYINYALILLGIYVIYTIHNMRKNKIDPFKSQDNYVYVEPGKPARSIPWNDPRAQQII